MNEPLSFWDMVKVIGLTEEDLVMDYKAWFAWHNTTKPDLVLTLLMDEKFVMLNKIRCYFEVILGVTDRRAKVFYMEKFKEALDKDISVYRGNAGVFNPLYPEKFHFIATTASFDIAMMFAKYPDAKATHLPIPPERDQYWVVSVTMPLRNIMAYRNLADQEVWITAEDYGRAKVMIQCGV